METIPENIIDNSKGAAKGVSEEECDMFSMVTLDNLDGLLFNSSSTVLFPFLFYFITTIPANLTELSPFTNNENEKMCCIFQAQPRYENQKTNAIQSKTSSEKEVEYMCYSERQKEH